MNYHGRVTGPGGKLYQCEHNHRTETAAITCANSSATRRMAEMVWQRAADKEAREATLAKQRAEERGAARARQSAGQAAADARRAAAKAASEQAKSGQAGSNDTTAAWKHMTPAERLLQTADLEMQKYGEIGSPNTLAAYEAQSAKPAGPEAPTESTLPRVPGSRRTNTAAAQLKFAAVAGLIFGVLASLVAGVLDAIVALVHYHVTVPARCVIAQPDGSVLYTHEPICSSLGTDLVWGTGLVFGIAVLLWILTVIVHALPKAQQVKLEAWASKPREAPPPMLRNRYTSTVNAVTPHGTRVRQKCCQRGHTTPDAAAQHAASVKLRIERRGA